MFNIELNTPPLMLGGGALRRMHDNLESHGGAASGSRAELDRHRGADRHSATLRDTDLTVEHMSDRERYRAINDQILRRQHGQPMQLAIHGAETLCLSHPERDAEPPPPRFRRTCRSRPTSTVFIAAPRCAVGATGGRHRQLTAAVRQVLWKKPASGCSNRGVDLARRRQFQQSRPIAG